jgi:16S rRNA (cytidine1402-2'-O)-methyltransferase
LPSTLRSLAAADLERELAVCRELTKRHEEIVRGSARELAERFADPPKGEITLVLGAGTAAVPGAAAAAAEAVAELVAAGVARRRATEVVARLTGVSRKALYDMSL